MKQLLSTAGIIACCLFGSMQQSFAAEAANPETKLSELKTPSSNLKELISVKSNRESLSSELEASEKKSAS